jgi:hypothetical protein
MDIHQRRIRVEMGLAETTKSFSRETLVSGEYHGHIEIQFCLSWFKMKKNHNFDY